MRAEKRTRFAITVQPQIKGGWWWTARDVNGWWREGGEGASLEQCRTDARRAARAYADFEKRRVQETFIEEIEL